MYHNIEHFGAVFFHFWVVDLTRLMVIASFSQDGSAELLKSNDICKPITAAVKSKP